MEEICSSCSNVHPSCTGSDSATSFFSAYAGYSFHFCPFYLFVNFVLKSTYTIQLHLLITLSIPHPFLFCGGCLLLKVKRNLYHHWRWWYMIEKSQNMLDSDSFQYSQQCLTNTSCILYMLACYIYMNAFFNSIFWIYSNLAKSFWMKDHRRCRESGKSMLAKYLPCFYSDDLKRK